jgi:single-stranded DNA-binding protein
MIDGLIAGRLHGLAQERTGKNGNPFVVAKLLAANTDGENLIVNVIAFETTTCKALLNLQEGDSLALAGSLTPRVWTDKQGAARPSLDMVAHQSLSLFDVQHKRSAAVLEP